MDKAYLTASLVLFHNDPAVYSRAISSFLSGCDGHLFVVDNSSSPLRHALFESPRVTYIFAGKNLGFGAGHNVAIRRLGTESTVHLLLNPDVEFGPVVLPRLTACLTERADYSAVMPMIRFEDGSLQKLAKLLPTPLDLIFRRFIPIRKIRELLNNRYELATLKHDQRIEIPNLSGCFLLVKTDHLLQLGGFDERYFMYMEDVDLVRRLGSIGKTIYEPAVAVTHGYAKGSYKNKALLGHHVRSAIRYFNKWGWFFDSIRRRRNRSILNALANPRLRSIGKNI